MVFGSTGKDWIYCCTSYHREEIFSRTQLAISAQECVKNSKKNSDRVKVRSHRVSVSISGNTNATHSLCSSSVATNANADDLCK